MKKYISLKTFILLLTTLALLLIISGFFYDTQGFVSNILAEITGLFLGIVVAILLVDRITENQRKKKWERVRQISHRTIAHHLNNIVLELFNHFALTKDNSIITPLNNTDLSDTYQKPNLNKVIQQIKKLMALEQIQPESVRAYFNAIKWDIAQIRSDLMPRIIQSSDQQELIDALIEFDDLMQDLQSMLIIKRQIIQPTFYLTFEQVFEKINDIYKLL